ncbi:hypothetical protein L1887_24690 [Cichorium endivia]|nr:hypothetical protein L1887_24690 [Cichorium endivia]
MGIHRFPQEIKVLVYLKSVFQPHSESEIPEEIWCMKKPEVIDLEGNMLNGNLNSNFRDLEILRVLNLGFIQISELAYSQSYFISSFLELRNIWQHVVRRKVESKPKSNNDQDKSDQGTENGHRTVKSNRKRGIEDEDVEENGHESGDPSAQKKPAVVWSIDLHRKFVAVVNQLGIESSLSLEYTLYFDKFTKLKYFTLKKRQILIQKLLTIKIAKRL